MNHSIVFWKNAGSKKRDFQPDSGPETVAVIEKQHIPERSITVKPRKGAFFLQRNPEGGSYRYEYVAGLLRKVEKKNAADTAWQTLESYEYQFTPVKKTSKTQYDDAGAITTTTTYDSAGRVSEVVDTAGRVNQQIIYNDSYLTKTIKNRLPNAKLDSIVYRSNPLGLVEAVTMILNIIMFRHILQGIEEE